MVGQGRPWWRLPAVLTCRPFGTPRKTNRPILSLIHSRVSFKIVGDEQVYQITRIVKERSGTCCSPNCQTLNGQDQVVTVGKPLVHVKQGLLEGHSEKPK